MCHCVVGVAATLLGREGSRGRGLMGKGSDNQHVVGGYVWQGAGVRGAQRSSWPPSETTWVMATNAAMSLFPPTDDKINYKDEDSG